MTSLHGCLLVSSLVFAVGMAGALTRRNSILVLAGIELMLNAANLNFVAFWRFGPSTQSQTQPVTGLMFVLFAIGVAAAEAAVGLALILAVYRHVKTTDLTELSGRRP